jgi:heat shock protein HtpX
VAARWFGRDRGLTLRMGLTMFGLGLVYVAFIAALIAAGAAAVLVLVVAAVVLLVQLLFSDRLALRSMGARTVTAQEEPELHAMIGRLCQLSDLDMPRVAVAETELPNAFAAGHSRRTATVCVTRGILRTLEPAELEGVLAHELSHIGNRDVVVMTVASFLATVSGLLIRFGAYGGMSRGRDNAAAVFLVVTLVSVATYVLSFVLLRALSRYREYAADRGAAIMTGAPATLASALLKLSGELPRIPTRDLRSVEGLNAFFIVPAVARGFSLSSIFSTHPPVQARVDRLMRMSAQMDARGGDL